MIKTPRSISNLFLILLVSAAGTQAQTRTQPAAPAAQQKPAAYTETIPDTHVRVRMVPLPAGTFNMGSPSSEKGRKADEGPRFRVQVDAFWMSRCEITWDTFDEFRRQYSIELDHKLAPRSTPKQTWVDAVSIPTPLWEQEAGPILEGLGTKGGFPVADISQFAAMQFTKWLSARSGHTYRLPTEAEWEYAARAGTQTAYFFGDDQKQLTKYAWTFDNSGYDDPDQGYPGVGAGYRKVGQKAPNPWGLYDMYGNVSEWVMDQYAAGTYATFKGGPVSWRAAVRFPTRIFPCVTRGGNWESDPAACRSAARLASDSQWQMRDPQIPKSLWWYTDAFHVGFRIVRPAQPGTRKQRLRFWESQAPGIQRVLRDGGKELRVSVGQSSKKGSQGK